MIEKCNGCGAEIQFLDNTKVGYIKEEVYNKRKEENKEILCERCFRLKHYNEVEKVTIDEDKFLEFAKSYLTNNMLICMIVDMFDLDGTIIKDINEIFPHNEVLVIGNKYDLFDRSNRPTKLKKYLSGFLSDAGIKTIGTIITSAIELDGAKKVYEAIVKVVNLNNLSRDVFFFGMSNSGKTTLLKSMGEVFNNEDSKKLITSKAISTTIGLKEIDLPDIRIIDSPGLVNDKQMTYYLNKKTIDYLMPKNFIKPTVYQLNPLQTIYIDGFGAVSLLEREEKSASFIFYVSSLVKLHRTKYEENYGFLEKHRKDIFVVPSKTERKKLGEMVKYEFNVNEDNELALAGIGFVGFNSSCKIEVLMYEKISVNIRKKMI